MNIEFRAYYVILYNFEYIFENNKKYGFILSANFFNLNQKLTVLASGNTRLINSIQFIELFYKSTQTLLSIHRETR